MAAPPTPKKEFLFLCALFLTSVIGSIWLLVGPKSRAAHRPESQASILSTGCSLALLSLKFFPTLFCVPTPIYYLFLSLKQTVISILTFLLSTRWPFFSPVITAGSEPSVAISEISHGTQSRRAEETGGGYSGCRR